VRPLFVVLGEDGEPAEQTLVKEEAEGESPTRAGGGLSHDQNDPDVQERLSVRERRQPRARRRGHDGRTTVTADGGPR